MRFEVTYQDGHGRQDHPRARAILQGRQLRTNGSFEREEHHHQLNMREMQPRRVRVVPTF